MKVVVTAGTAEQAWGDLGRFQHGSVWIFTGVNDQGRPVSFGVDARMALELATAVEEAGELDVEVEPWQIL